jgi:hypothetical protein
MTLPGRAIVDRVNIAAHASGRKNVSNEPGNAKNFAQSGLVRRYGASCASHPHWMCYHFAVCSISPDQLQNK